MILQTPLALLGLLLAIPVALLHLRRRRPRVQDVPSLLAWRHSPAATGASSRRLGRPAHPWLLVLQLLALVLLVLVLARPHTDGGPPGATRVFVIDDSIWMQAREAGHTRLETAESSLCAELGELPGDQRVAIFLAGAEPRLLYQGDADDSAGALGPIFPTFGPADLPAALRLAADLPPQAGSIELLRAPEDAAPETIGSPGRVRDRVVGSAIADQGIAEPSARCRPGSNQCRLFARIENTATTSRSDRVEVLAAGRPESAQTVSVPPGGSVPVAFNAPAGARLVLSLGAGDALAADDRAYVDVPAAAPVRITLIGEKDDAEPLARALLAVPEAKVTLRTPADFRPADARRAELLVIDGQLPHRPLPAGVPAILRVDPPRLPGGAVGGSLARNRLSGTDQTAAVLDGVDLDSLSIGRHGAHRLSLPPWLRAAAWASGGPLLAVGVHAGCREAVLAFDPSESNLPQLPSFPRLVENLVSWSQEWAPAWVSARAPFLALRPPMVGPTGIADMSGAKTTSARMALELDRPGLYDLRQHGPFGVRSRRIAANAELVVTPLAAAPVFLAAPAAAVTGAEGTDLWPWFLAAAVAVLLLEASLSIRLQGPSRAFLILRGAAIILAAVAFFRPQVGFEAPPTTVLVPRTPGPAPGEEIVGRRWKQAAEQCGGNCRVLEPSSTDLEASVREAVGATPDAGRLVVLSNGRQTDGEATTATAEARARGVKIDIVPLAERRRDAAVTRLQIPAALHAGDPLPVEVTVRSTVAASGSLSLFEDGIARGTRPIHLAVGDNPYLLSLDARGPGSHSYRAVIHMPDDAVPRNDSLAATLRVGRRPRALVVSSGTSPLLAMLRGDGIAVSTVAPNLLPADPAALGRFDAVALDDVRAPELGTARARSLVTAVRTGLTGLLVLGGPHSFSLGGYYDSPLQDALPVGSLKPGNLQRRNLGLEMILDRSGSMAEAVSGVPKISMVRTAAHAATTFLAKHHDELGTIAFDVSPHTVVPLTRLNSSAQADAVNRAIDRIRAEGGTNIYKALAAGATQIEASDEPLRHIVLLSDGISEKGSYARLVPRLRAEHITVSTVALGADADYELLSSIARSTGGHFYATDEPRDLPKIFAKDTRAAARPVRLHGQIGVTPGEPSPVVRELAGTRLPDLHGNVVTQVKPGAEAVLLGTDKDHPPDPLLSQWQYGAGRVVAWTPGLGKQWAAAWAELPAIWSDAVRWVAPAPAPKALTLRAAPGEQGLLDLDEAEGVGSGAGLAAIEGSIVAPGGRPRPLSLEARAPWRWTASLPDRSPGVDAYAIRRGATTSRGLVAVPYSPALRPLPADATPLGPLAAGTGGRVLAVDDTATLTGHRTDLWWLFVLGALLCFLASVAARLLPFRRSTPSGLRRRPGATPSPDRRADRVDSTTSAPA